MTKYRICSIKNCNGKHYAKGYCQIHYHKSDTFKKSQKKYYQSDKGKKSKIRYKQTDNGKKSQKRYEQSDKGKKVKFRKKLKKYNITPEEYNKMLENQSNKCAICGSKPIKRQLAVDHDHKTNKIRGLLCNCCNVGLGNFKDDEKLLQRAVKYRRNNGKI